MYRHGNHLTIESLPNSDGSYMMARFTLDGRIATGSYHSQNSPKSATKGAIYYGAAQLILDEDGNALHGLGVGFGRDMKVKMSNWDLFRLHDRVTTDKPAQKPSGETKTPQQTIVTN
jgi:hypothetical protein